jgi:hypothetical protein
MKKKAKTNPFAWVFFALIVSLLMVVAWAAMRPDPPAPVQVKIETPTGTAPVNLVADEKAIGEAARRDLEAVEREWTDTIKLASSTSRIALAPIVKDLQEQARTIAELELSACLEPARPFLAENRNEVVAGFLSFMQDGSDANAILSDHLDNAARARRNYVMVIDGCSTDP